MPLPPLAGLSIERLKTFCLVAEEGSIVAAARDDVTRQSQYSRQIKELEESVGDRLFHREGKKFTLTQAGRSLALATQSYFGTIEDIRASATGEASLIRIGAGESVFRLLVLSRFQELAAANPGLRFDLHTMRTREVIDRVNDGRLDLGIIRSDALEEPLAGIAVGAMDFRWVVPRSLLPGKSAAGVHLIKELPFAMLTGDGKLTKSVLAIAMENGLKISVRLCADNFGLILEALQNSDLAAVLPAPAAAMLSQERFAEIQLPGMDTLRRELSLVHNPKVAGIRTSIKRVAVHLAKTLAR